MAAISTLAAIATIAGGVAGVAGALKKPKTPDMPDPAAERAKAETEALQKTNSKLAQRNRAREASSLLAKPLDSTTSDVGALGGGKEKLGS
jgi:hypothetical protein